MFLSAAMMLEWLGEKHGVPEAEVAGAMIRDAVDVAFTGGQLAPFELGGSAGTTAISEAVMGAL